MSVGVCVHLVAMIQQHTAAVPAEKADLAGIINNFFFSLRGAAGSIVVCTWLFVSIMMHYYYYVSYLLLSVVEQQVSSYHTGIIYARYV